MRSLALIAAGLALGIGTGAVVIARSQAGDEAAPRASPEPLRASGEGRASHEGNRRILTAVQTQRLVHYATALHECLEKRGVDVAVPKKDSRSITIRSAEAVGAARLVALMTPCTPQLGDPPKPSSLQAVDARTIVLSVPKQCLLDPNTELTTPQQP